MSDTTVITDAPQAETPAPVDVTTKIETPLETPEPEVEVKAEEPAPAEKPETDEPDEPKKKPSGIDRMKRRLALTQADLDTLARENEELRRRTAASDTPQQGKPGIDRPPTEQDFPNDYLAYERAANTWQVRQAVREEISKVENKSRDAQLREIRQERVETYEENVEQVRERIPDFDKVVASATGVNVSNDLADEIMQSEKPALIQYHLAQKPELVRELNGLSGRELARAVAKIEARVHLPQPKKATDALPPPSVVKGAAAQAVDPVAGPDDMNAYVAWRRKKSA